MKYILAIAAALLLTGCPKPAQKAEQANSFRVETLFTHEGCTLYRFYDHGNPIYYSDCKGSTQWSERRGKSSQPVGVSGGAE